MIGSFWNLCRACPSMPVDKLHSEYRSTYRWHEYTGPRQEVVRRAPQGGHANAVPPSDERRHDFGTTATRIDEESHERKSNKHNLELNVTRVMHNGRVIKYLMSPVPKLEPAMPRRKKYPDLAYRHHEFIAGRTDATDSTDNSVDRARSEERGVSHWRPSRRSRSEGPARTIRHLMNGARRRDSDPDIPNMEDETGRDSGLLKKAISKISTEYRLQFAWPQGHVSRREAAANAANAGDAPRKSQSMGALKPAANAMIHRKRNDFEPKDGNASELEPLVNENSIKEEEFKMDTMYKKDFKPYVRGKKDDTEEASKHLLQNGIGINKEWIRECAELRKKAGEYKNRGWGSKFAPEIDIYNKQVELWDQVSRRSSLSALSLASTAHRNYTKEEKDQENNKKSSPTKALRNAENSARLMKDMIRHHLERTTGGTEFDGLILSPTREKLEPTIPKRDDDSRGSQKNSPKKNSPQKNALQKKNSLKSKSALKTARSQSVGPADMNSTEKRSPKRQSRSATATTKEKKPMVVAVTPAATITAAANTTPATTNHVPVTKRPRPSSLNTTASSRSKSSSVPSKHEDERLVKSKSNKNSSNESNVRSTKDHRKGFSASEKTERSAPEVNEVDPIDFEPVVKSPPEPTRVKSPEQIMIRSPDPVNWTVPLDTGKTFTVTQNVREAGLLSVPNLPAISQESLVGEPPIATSCSDHRDQTPPASPTASTSRSIAGDVLQMARDRFDAFWGRNGSEEV